ncbi:hypothetical protein KVR01_008228 [Diaporthe batatas]|uniref:uncharacterized protein n=1 Tax=Diaporthe batatas TaxID=748121 RepID=UPI001D03ECD3|nr:uncharacterized protein KVR01_008228 [Diaporthe batatas]KAG8162463.1 hypothetical protein KVR01_008228 [Diaporthe batatas]
MDDTNTATSQARRATRSSLACLPCRSRHLKCDATRPQCNRCLEVSRECQYAPSRRGGLDRAALAERRKRLALAGSVGVSDTTKARTARTISVVQQDQELPSQPLELYDLPSDLNSLEEDSIGNGTPASASASAFHMHTENIEGDPLITSYYKHFHTYHPFLLPQKALIRLHRDANNGLVLAPVIALMRLVGHLYAAQELSTQLRDHAEMCIAGAPSSSPTVVQCRLLYSIVLFWHNFKSEANSEMKSAVKLAVDLKMFRQEFASDHGAGDPVLMECWRRTWWMLYIVDAYYAGTLGTMNFSVFEIDATVDLPCEEREYESEQIPIPNTLEEFDSREFSTDDVSFSSFAYLIGAVKCAALAISISPKVAAKEDSTGMIQSADSIIDGWSLLLPKERKEIMTKTGNIDELMFQAHLLIHVATIGLHRPLSDLKFNPVEAVSSCAREPPNDNPTPDLINVHTVRVLRSIEAQIRLLALPFRPFSHTPFVTCMVSEGTLALLSACAFQLSGKELAVARDQIRMTIGCLRDLGELWPRTAINVKEIQTVARHVLGLRGLHTIGSSSTETSSNVPSLSGGGSHGSLGSESGEPCMEDGVLGSLGSMEDVCGWYNLGVLGPELEHWMGDGL